MTVVADSFAWPFRGTWRPRWAIGLLMVLFLPLLFIPLLGYAVAATRAAETERALGPPPWRFSARLLTDGLWTAGAIALITLPFGFVLGPLANLLFDAHLYRSGDATVSMLFARVLALCLLALPWGLALLLHMPHATSTFAATGRPADLFNLAAAIRGVRADFATWNLVAAAIVTGWAIGLACTGLLCVGVLPGLFYAILVSAHASAAIHHEGSHPPAR